VEAHGVTRLHDNPVELSQADYDRRLIDALRAKAPRTCRLQAEVRDVVDTLDAGPRRFRLEGFLLLLAAMADSGVEVSDGGEAYVREVLG
jgi:hypothetical protein